MRVLWKINTILPYPAEKIGMFKNSFGGWINSLLNIIIENNEIEKIAIISNYDGNILQKFENNKLIYYLVPSKNNLKYDRKLLKYYKNINEEFKPDVIHIHGTEYPSNYNYLESCSNNLVITSIQGLVSEYAKYYYADISFLNLLKCISFKEILNQNILLKQKKDFQKRGVYEIKQLKNSNIIIGRTSWDKAATNSITDINKYRFCNENLRDSFYNKKWNINNIEKHSIFISQASYPIKGFHKVIEAANLLKEKYSDLKIYVAGSNILKANTLKEKIKISGYANYLKNLIKKYGLEKNIEFTGILNENEMSEKMLKSNIFVQASAIENSSNSLGEAMLLGMPIVASYVGGTGDMLKDKEEGLLYPFSDYTMLAYYISYLFDNSNEAIAMGLKAQKHAQKTHNRKENAKRMIEIYKELINERHK